MRGTRVLRRPRAAVAAGVIALGLGFTPSAWATSVTGVSLTPNTFVSATSATWGITFAPSSSGALVTGNTVDVTFPTGFTFSGLTAAFVSGFTSCATPTPVLNGHTVIVPLTGAGCSLGANTPAALTISGISAAASQYSRFGFSVTTYADSTFTSPIDGSGANPPTFIDILASVTYSTHASDNSLATGTAPTDPSQPYSTVISPTVTVLGNVGGTPLTLSGHTFAGWCTTNNAADPTLCTGTHYDAGDTFTIAANTTLYSQWTGGLLTPTTPSVSNLPSSGTYGGGFTASVNTNGDGTKSVTSNSTGVCTVSGFTVTYVGVGTCSLTAHVGVGSTYNSANGTAQTFAVGQAAASTPAISNLPSSVTYGGGFTASVSTSGDGTTSVTSSSTGVCTVSGSAVSYVGVGTCSLTAHVAAGTDYSSANGNAQTFSVNQATPTVPSISNVPSSGSYGGSFTATVSTNGDGSTSITALDGRLHRVGVGRRVRRGWNVLTHGPRGRGHELHRG